MGEVIDLPGKHVYIDTNIIIYAVEGYLQHEPAIRSLLAAMDRGDLFAVTSELTLAEVLVKPLQEHNPSLQKAYRDFLEPSPAFNVAPISRDILLTAADIRATTGLRLPDAIHAATALYYGCDCFFTNDRSFRAITTIPVKFLSTL